MKMPWKRHDSRNSTSSCSFRTRRNSSTLEVPKLIHSVMCVIFVICMFLQVSLEKSVWDTLICIGFSWYPPNKIDMPPCRLSTSRLYSNTIWREWFWLFLIKIVHFPTSCLSFHLIYQHTMLSKRSNKWKPAVN